MLERKLFIKNTLLPLCHFRRRMVKFKLKNSQTYITNKRVQKCNAYKLKHILLNNCKPSAQDNKGELVVT